MKEVSAWTLVACTCQHARFAELYALPSYDKCWQRLQRRYDWLDQRIGGGVKPVLYALDWRALSLVIQPFACATQLPARHTMQCKQTSLFSFVAN